MRAFWVFVLLASGCTQDFDAFEPAGDASAEGAADGSSDAAPPPSDAAPDGGCSETGAVVFGGHCYFLVQTMQSFDTAKAGCESSGAHLVTITGSAEQSTVSALGAGIERWIGLERTTGAPIDANYLWITGEPRGSFSAWSAGEPNGTGLCGRMLANGNWADQACSATLASVCERE